MIEKLRQFRQGDILIRQISSLPANAIKKPHHGHIVLALGEVTGHSHTLAADPETTELFLDEDGEMFFRILAPATITHQEHDEVKLPVGIYAVKRQREYEPKGIRRVMD